MAYARTNPSVSSESVERREPIEARRLGRAISDLLARLDAHPRTYQVGITLAAVLLVALALGVAALESVLALAIVLLGFVVPPAGLLISALLVAQRDPWVFIPLGLAVPLITAIGLGCTMRLALERPTLRIGAVTAFMIAYGGFTLYQVLQTALRHPGDQASFAIEQFTRLAAGLALFAASVYVGRRHRIEPYLTALVASAALAGALGLLSVSPGLGAAAGGLIAPSDGVGRAIGPFGNPNYFGFFLATALVFVVGWADLLRGRERRLLLAVAVLVGAALLATFSRGAIAMAAVGLIVLAFRHGRRTGLLALLVIAAVVVASYPVYLAIRHEITFGAAGPLAEAAQDQSDLWRLDAMLAGVSIILSAPIVGWGFGQYHYVSPRFLGDSPVTYSHNAYLNALGEQGLIGALLFAGLLISIAVAVWRSRSGIRWPVVAVFATYLFGALFAEPFTSLQTSGLTWMLLGLAVGAGALPDDGGAPPVAMALPWSRVAIPTDPRSRWPGTGG